MGTPFLQPCESLPFDPVHGWQDWDAPATATDWPRFLAFLRLVKATGAIPPDHKSHDHLNTQKDVPMPQDVVDRWRAVFVDAAAVKEEEKGRAEKVNIVWVLVDGFLLYWNAVGLECEKRYSFFGFAHEMVALAGCRGSIRRAYIPA